MTWSAKACSRELISCLDADHSGCRRTIYVCDDGKDRKKRRLCQRLGRDCIYVSGRQRATGEMNGKSGNLNNCCRQIYPEGCTIPANEVICIMDADQVSSCCHSILFSPLMMTSLRSYKMHGAIGLASAGQSCVSHTASNGLGLLSVGLLSPLF